ncbi:MAG: LA2681 family HEPN domain-containing protein [Clostridium sp.]
MENSPFAPICNELAADFDAADIAGDIDKTRELIENAKKILSTHDAPEYAPLFYSVGTSITILRDNLLRKSTARNLYMNSEVIETHSQALWYFRHAEELLQQIEENKENYPYLTGIRMILYVNLGNALDFCGRKCSAMDYYSKAAGLHPFGMALGNIGKTLEHYAFLEGDEGHRAVLYREAYKYYWEAEQANDAYTYETAKKEFAKRRKDMEVCFGKENLKEQSEFIPIETESEEEFAYRKWCLENHLFLNTLNDLSELNEAFMQDALYIMSITTAIEQENPPFVFEMFNQVKEEYIYARYLLFEVINPKAKVHFADKETHLEDILNYSSYSIRLEKLKTAYRTLYSILDRIAFLLNSYLELGISEWEVNFDSIWKRLEEKENKNIALSALHWINRDFKEKFGNADIPYTKKLKKLRNALEHKFVSIHMFPVERNVEIGKDYIYRVSEENLVEYSLDLLKLIREAVIELMIAIRIEEMQRNCDKKNVFHVSMTEYLDEFKI